MRDSWICSQNAGLILWYLKCLFCTEFRRAKDFVNEFLNLLKSEFALEYWFN